MNRTMIRGLALDVGLPVAAYYLLHFLGASDFLALLASTLVAALRVVITAIRQRTLNPFATLMLLIFGIGLVLALVSGDPRFLLLKESFTTGAIGLAFLITAIIGKRPLTLAAGQSWNPDQATELAEAYRTDPDIRRGYRTTSTVWGLGLLFDALVRVPLVYLLPASIVVGLSTAILVVVIVVLVVWTRHYVSRATGQHNDHSHS